MNDLLLTLGHNSSAILVGPSDDGKREIICGYEEERLTLKKSDSSFPINAIRRCLEVAQIQSVRDVYVTHWAPDGQIESMSKKHWDPSALPEHKHIVATTSLTHHDTHAHAAMWYAMSKPGLKPADTMIFVIDGFGNFGEHISIYQMTGWGPKLVRRFFGYDGSLGLMYQYMTSFMGMKMHEDEYKILGYEVLIHQVDVDFNLLHKKIHNEITRYLDGYFDNKVLVGKFDPLIRLDALPAIQKNLIDRWVKLCNELELDDPTSHEARIVLSYYVQSVLEGVVTTLVRVYNPTNLICSGGVFYNVKLNRKLAELIKGKLCVYPLAGDQGNALGLYSVANDLKWPGHLCWGKRPSEMFPEHANSLIKTRNIEDTITKVLHEISLRGICNLVRGAMEFGPRALCNTSTLGLPTPPIVNRINRMNGRNTVMPMAPVMNRAQYLDRMKLTDKIHLSEHHMIVALPYKDKAHVDVLGAAHPYEDEYTGRPQVLDNDPIMDYLLTYFPVLINTSFNVHGRPIAYTFEDVVANHNHQRKMEPITTVYLEMDDENSR